MIPKPEIIKLIRFKILDAKALLAKKRYAGCIYIAGYAVELALKYKICRTLRFKNGFPENKNEFNNYRNSSAGIFWRNTITDVRKIKNHDLAALLFYSGEQLNIVNNFTNEWNKIRQWTEQLRYSTDIVRATKAKDFLSAAEIVIKQLM